MSFCPFEKEKWLECD
uniref:Uncharacterized protein n=1 Tax=Anguilla anguilla TaxID=7936 RepID=A0A0E9UIH2_ANGAN